VKAKVRNNILNKLDSSIAWDWSKKLFKASPWANAQRPQGYARRPRGHARRPRKYAKPQDMLSRRPQGFAKRPEEFAQRPQGLSIARPWASPRQRPLRLHRWPQPWHACPRSPGGLIALVYRCTPQSFCRPCRQSMLGIH